MPRALHMQVTSMYPTSTPNATIRLAGRGFSLLELVLVIVIIATIAGIALPRMSSSTNISRADQAMDRIEATLNKAREMARSRSTSVSVRFRTSSERLKIIIGGSTVEKIFLESSPYYADMTAASFGTDKYIIYNGFGMQDTGGTASIAVGSAKRTLTVADPPTNDSSSRVVSLTRSTQLDTVNLNLVITGGTGVDLGN
jgi:prepilin-type N-terminal cleavage/methylation domain-containing protein